MKRLNFIISTSWLVLVFICATTVVYFTRFPFCLCGRSFTPSSSAFCPLLQNKVLCIEILQDLSILLFHCEFREQ